MKEKYLKHFFDYFNNSKSHKIMFKNAFEYLYNIYSLHK